MRPVPRGQRGDGVNRPTARSLSPALANSLLLDVLRQLGQDPADVVERILAARDDDNILQRMMDRHVQAPKRGVDSCGECAINVPGMPDGQLQKLGWDVLRRRDGSLFRICPACCGTRDLEPTRTVLPVDSGRRVPYHGPAARGTTS